MPDSPPLPKDWTDREAIELWLRIQPHEVSIALAARAALRVLPLIWPPVEEKANEFREELVLRGFKGTSKNVAISLRFGRIVGVGGMVVSRRWWKFEGGVISG
jgi:hypothetical protein